MSGEDKRVFIIGSAILVMVAVVLVLGSALFETRTAENGKLLRSAEAELMPSKRDAAAEAGPFTRVVLRPPDKSDPPARTLEVYYSRRAYPGAPPSIPHPIENTPGFESGKTCRACHIRGGFVPKFNAFSPATPHPDFQNCVQCHTPSRSEELFRDNDWASVRPPKRGLAAMKGAPPAIPHSLQMRETCIACHSGPASIVAIRSSHPERGNCRQCHMPRMTQEIFDRNVRP